MSEILKYFHFALLLCPDYEKEGGMIYSGVVHHTDVYFPYIWGIQAG